MSTFTRQNPTQVYEIFKMIDANGTRIGNKFSYNAGWSDKQVADKIGVQPSCVTYRRLRTFGELVNGLVVADDPSIEARLTHLEARLTKLETKLGIC